MAGVGTDTRSLNLTDWMKHGVTNLYASLTRTSPHSSVNATDATSTFSNSYGSVMSPNAVVVVNGQKIDAELLKENYEGLRGATAHIDLEWGDVKEESTEGAGYDSGTVVGEYTITRSLRFRIRVGPAQAKTKIRFRAE